MATSLKELIVTYQANAKPVLDALNQIDAKIRQTSKSIKSVGDSFVNVGKDITMSMSAPLGLLSVKALQASADFETLKMKMEVLTGSAEKGSEIFEKLVKFAAETPFELNELANATNTLMGFGETADDAFSHIGLLGDVAAVVGADFSRLAVTFGSASAEGKLMTKDLRELINNGIPIIKLLSESMGVAQGKIFDLAEQGKISFPVLIKTLEKATGKGGMFEGGMAKLSRTSKGVYSTFKDNVNIALAKFGDEMQLAFGLTGKLEAFGAWIGRLADNFQRLEPSTRKNILLIIGFVAVLGPLLIIIGTLIRLIGLATLAFNFIIAPIRLLITLLPALLGILRGIMLVFAANPLTAFIAATIAIVYYWKEIVELFKQAADWVSKISVSGMWDKVKDFSGKITSKITGGANDAVSAVTTDSSIANNQKTVNNNLTVNIPPGTSSSDSASIKNAIFAALSEQNRQSYIEVGAQ
jgi:tape measure domain-containing protein